MCCVALMVSSIWVSKLSSLIDVTRPYEIDKLGQDNKKEKKRKEKKERKKKGRERERERERE